MSFRPHLLSGLATVAIVASALPAPAYAQQSIAFDIPAQDLGGALRAFAQASGVQVIFDGDALRGKRSQALRGSYSADAALTALLRGSGMSAERNAEGVFVVTRAVADNSTTDDSGYRGEEIIVTAQKRVESAQKVPIAITALSQKNLDEQKIEGGPDIMRAVPNLTFSKSNFTGYNLSIRGVGTKAISATSDPGVAIAFNNAGLIHNRFFEQEFFDMERLEVLRGPQGTLYGRNATGGVVNLISAKPKLSEFEGSIKGEVGNYNSRRMVGMLNVPLVDDVLGVRIAGSMTQRDGYDYNLTTKNRVNGRDLWSLRSTVAFEPEPWFRANLVWERFRENDNRSRTGKQLCHRDDSPTHIGSTDLMSGVFTQIAGIAEARAGNYSQGCKPGSLYDDGAFGTPNGLSLPFIQAALNYKTIGVSMGLVPAAEIGSNAVSNRLQHIIRPIDPYGGLMQSRNLREISSIRDPKYRASSDLLQLNFDIDITDSLSFVSQTAYNEDKVYSFQDYNRFNSVPIFWDTSKMTYDAASGGPMPWVDLAPGGIFCDPQIGCSDSIAGFDISQSKSKQFSQEFRLQSDFDGPFNFSIGANYTRFKSLTDYYVMYNMFTALAVGGPFNSNATIHNTWPGGIFSPGYCTNGAFGVGTGMIPTEQSGCPYVDPNPVESINGEGHNYFRSKNPYKLRSYAMFGEAYWNITEDVKLTAGLRYSDDRKTFTPVPSQLLLAPSIFGGGLVSKGYPERPDIVQSWGEFTGRFGLDWKPNWSFTDDSLLYAFYSRGYKGGGANPPTPGYATKEEYVQGATEAGLDPFILSFYELYNYFPILQLTGVDYESTFKPEYVNAIEIGTKNTFLNGALTLNASAFFYDYKDYQVSQIKDRTAVNENFDAQVWGAELEARFAPTRNLRLNANVGYLKTKIGKGESSIDLMNRTQGDPNYIVSRGWVQLPSNCVVPLHVAEQAAASLNFVTGLCAGTGGLLQGRPFDPLLNKPYDPMDYPEINGGAGIRADLSGNELPNSPRWTVNLGAEYTIPFDGDWSATIRGDGYWQGKSWARVYNLAPYDRLRSWTNFNISLRVDGPDDLSIEAYVKNVFNSTPITDAFLNSDDSGLTTNVFTLDPRIIGFSISKKF